MGSSAEVAVGDFPKDELPINLGEVSSHWIGMNKIEAQKLTWMTELPLPKPIDPSTGYVARFNFEGIFFIMLTISLAFNSKPSMPYIFDF